MCEEKRTLSFRLKMNPQHSANWSGLKHDDLLYIYLAISISTSLIHSNSIRQQPSNCGYKPNTADISLTSPLYGVFVSLKKCLSLYTGLPLFLFLFFVDNEETDSAEFETRYDYCTFKKL